jgi:hypothetical protein
MVLLTTQITLVRSGNVALNLRLGVFGAWLVVAMLGLGVGAAIVVERLAVGTTHDFPSFLAVQFGDIILFGCVAAAGLWNRRDAASHKRLMLLATFALAGAGYGRWWAADLEAILGKGLFGEWIANYLGNILLILGLGGYDLATRGRLNRPYAIGAGWVLAMQLVINWLLVSPWFKPIAVAIIAG